MVHTVRMRSLLRPGSAWTVDDLPDMKGRTVMVTGGTSGIGKEAAREFVRHGAHVVLPAITQKEGDATAAVLGGSVEVHALDLTDIDAVRRFAEEYTEPIDILLDNAGLMSKTLRHTSGGTELHLAVNFLGPFLLTSLLMPRIRERVVITASMAHEHGTVDLDDPDFERRPYSMAAAYAQSKLACMLWALELQRRFDQRGEGVDVQIAHPGFAATSILDPTPIPPLNTVLNLIARPVIPTAADGARPLLYAATQDLPPASYVGPTGFKGIAGAPGPGRRAPRAEDRDLARRLWEWAEERTGSVSS